LIVKLQIFLLAHEAALLQIITYMVVEKGMENKGEQRLAFVEP